MNDDDAITSFDSLCHEHNLSGKDRDRHRIFFMLGLRLGQRSKELMPGPQKISGVLKVRHTDLLEDDEHARQAKQQGQDSKL